MEIDLLKSNDFKSDECRPKIVKCQKLFKLFHVTPLLESKMYQRVQQAKTGPVVLEIFGEVSSFH